MIAETASVTAAPPSPEVMAREWEKIQKQLERYGFELVVVNAPVPCIRVRLVNKTIQELHATEIYVPVNVFMKCAGSILSVMDLGPTLPTIERVK